MKRGILFTSLFLAFACSNRQTIPAGVIPQDSMYRIMLDVMIAEEYSLLYLSKDSLIKDKTKSNQDLLEEVCKIHHITRETFKESINFYESRPDLTRKIFDSLTAYGNLHRNDMYIPKLVKPTPIPVK